MPKMISLRSFRLETRFGHVLHFEAKKPKFVPDLAVSAAMAAGCVPADGEEAPFHDDLGRARVEFVGDVRKSMIYLAVKQIAEKNDAKQFDGGGTPKTAVVSDMLGFEINRKDLVEVYQTYLTDVKEGTEYQLHPVAPNVLRVIEADSKDELVALADEFGVDAAKAKGLSVKDLRKTLLVKLSGVA